jgi:ATP-binding cassette subfamily F protein 3
MSSHLLQVDDLAFGYGADQLFRGVGFSIASGDRMALVAPNGAGKSTLLRLLAGELAPDAGRVVRRKGLDLGYYRQSHELDLKAKDATVIDAFLSGFGEIVELRHRLHQAREGLGAATDETAALAELSRLEDAYHLAHGDDLERKITILSQRLGFADRDLDRPVTSLSGGERGRLLLGTVLAREPELLLLDEPTNHLDLETIAWLEEHLRGFGGGLLVVSHDRRFLDRVTNQTAELGARSFRTYPVSYGRYVEQRADDLERERALVARQQAHIEKTEDFIRRNIAGQNTKQAQGRRKMLDKLERLERPEDVWADASKLRIRFPECPRSGDIVIDATGLGATRGGVRLFGGLDLLIRRGERIGIVGPNGAGKSTLLKILAGRGDPSLDEGRVRHGTNLEAGYFDQHLGTLDPARTAVEEIRSVRGDMNADVARQYLARFRITGDDALRVIGGFSGGERSRLALAKLLLEPRNLLYLDEPTNHLDIPACEILERALESGFDGTLILVSHDRQFLETVTTRLVVVKDGRAEVFPGGYREFAGKREAAREAEREPTGTTRQEPRKTGGSSVGRPTPASSPAETPEEARRAHESRKAAARENERKKRRVDELEVAIARAEAELAVMRAELGKDPEGDWAGLAKKAERERAVSRKLDEMVEEWTRLSEELASANASSSAASADAASRQVRG